MSLSKSILDSDGQSWYIEKHINGNWWIEKPGLSFYMTITEALTSKKVPSEVQQFIIHNMEVFA